MGFVDIAGVNALVKAGRIRVLAITSEQQLPERPENPSQLELCRVGRGKQPCHSSYRIEFPFNHEPKVLNGRQTFVCQRTDLNIMFS